MRLNAFLLAGVLITCSNSGFGQHFPPPGHYDRLPSQSGEIIYMSDRPYFELVDLANDGDQNAQYELGRRYANGDGIEQDIVRAYFWYRVAAEQDHRAAASGADYLGQFLSTGDREFAERRLDAFYDGARIDKLLRTATAAPQEFSPPAPESDIVRVERVETLAPVAQRVDLAPIESEDIHPHYSPERDAESMRLIQQALAALGYNPGPVDGAMGPLTRAAIRRYQQSQQLPVDGRASLALMDDLASQLQQHVPRETKLSAR